MLYAIDTFSHVVIITTNEDHYYIFILKIRQMRPREIKELAEGQWWSQHLFPGSAEEKAAILKNHQTAYPKWSINIYYCYNQKAVFKNENGLQTIAHFWCKQILLTTCRIWKTIYQNRRTAKKIINTFYPRRHN